MLGVERCLFLFVLDSQWKRAPPCHSNSPGAKLLSPDGTNPRHSLLGDDDYHDNDEDNTEEEDDEDKGRYKNLIL